MSLNDRALLLKRKTQGQDPLVDEVLANPEGPLAGLYYKAAQINVSKTKKPYVEACLIASQDLAEISEILGINVDVLQAYCDFFYDIADFDKLSKLDLLNVDDKQEGLMKIWAFSQGLDFIAWRLGRKVNISPVDGLQDLFATCIMKSREAMFSGNASEESKEATKWVKLSLDLARLLKAWVMDTEAAKSDIEMALRSVSPSFDGFDKLDDFTTTDSDASTEPGAEQSLLNFEGFPV